MNDIHRDIETLSKIFIGVLKIVPQGTKRKRFTHYIFVLIKVSSEITQAYSFFVLSSKATDLIHGDIANCFQKICHIFISSTTSRYTIYIFFS